MTRDIGISVQTVGIGTMIVARAMAVAIVGTVAVAGAATSVGIDTELSVENGDIMIVAAVTASIGVKRTGADGTLAAGIVTIEGIPIGNRVSIAVTREIDASVVTGMKVEVDTTAGTEGMNIVGVALIAEIEDMTGIDLIAGIEDMTVIGSIAGIEDMIMTDWIAGIGMATGPIVGQGIARDLENRIGPSIS